MIADVGPDRVSPLFARPKLFVEEVRNAFKSGRG